MTRPWLPLLVWLAGMASAPVVSLAIWLWLTRMPTSGCYGLGDGASLATFAAAPLQLALDVGRDPGALVCIGPAVLLPVAALAMLLTRPRLTRGALVLCALGYVALVLTSVVVVSAGC